MDKKQLLRSVAEKEYNTLDELVTEAARIIPHIAQEQKRYRVSVYPDERTIRYYINEGLVDKPSPSPDKPSRFTYRHLLQILAIKHLQAQYLPLNKIKEMLAGLKEEQLEEMITGRQEEYVTYDSIASPLRRRAVVHEDIARIPALHLSTQARAGTPRRPIKRDTTEEWLRISVTDEIELSIRAKFIPGTPEKRKEFMERLVAKLRIYLEDEKNRGGI